MINEIWKDIKGYEGLYQASNLGHIKSIRNNKILKCDYSHNGYRIVDLQGKTFRVHRLVAQTFLPNPDNLPQINHIDGNKQNNCVDNLEWISNYANIQHAIKNGLINQELRKENMRKVGKTGIGAKIRWN